MNLLELAKRTLATVRASKNGPCEGYELNEVNELSPHATVPPTSSHTAVGLPPAFLLITGPSYLESIATAISEADLVAVDLETTGLNARTDRARLMTIAVESMLSGEPFAYALDLDQVDPRPLFPALAERSLVFHNALFDLSFLMGLGLEPRTCHDTMLLSQLIYGSRRPKGFHSLGECVKRELGQFLPKELQRSDWSGPLTEVQLEYAAKDAIILLPLFDALSTKVRATCQEQVADIERRCLLGMTWLSVSGMPFDRLAWQALAQEATQKSERLTEKLDAAAPPRPGYLSRSGAWLWSSPADVKEAFEAVGITLESTDDDALAAVVHPMAALLREYRSASKLASTYGIPWLEFVAENDRVYADWRQMGCITGRMSSSHPNLQNLPGDKRYRLCFRAPEGRTLVKADYSQIELRIAAKITGDRALLEAYRTGQDVHTLTARSMTGKQEVTAAERKLAKPVNFGLIYGLSAKTLRRKALAEYGVEMSVDEAERYKAAFFRTYNGVNFWHSRIRRQRATEVRTLAGRGIEVEADWFYGGKANYAVQGTGGDGLKAALGLLWERRGECPGAFPVAAVHDEIVVECAEQQAEAVSVWLRQAMLDGMAPLISPVPVEAEVKVGRTWAG